MIATEKIEQLAEEKLEGSNVFLVDVQVKPGNKILVEIDSDKKVSIDDCVALSRHIESNLDRESEDFELQVSSAGLGQPLKKRRQYQANLGREVKVVLQNGQELKGKLLEAEDNMKLMLPASKKKKLPEREEIVAWDQIKETKVTISFK